MKKIATITWVAYYNYGTYLQAYALQRYIKFLGYDNKILDDGWVIPPNHLGIKGRIKKCLASIIPSLRRYRHSSSIIRSACKDFKKQCLDIDMDSKSLFEGKERYDIYVCGSDQIWSPVGIHAPNQEFYFATFTHQKKISYAPSLGSATLSPEAKITYRKWLKGFSYLSAREQEGVKLLSECSDQPVDKVVDPTFLLSKANWEMLLSEKAGQEKYALGYFLTYNASYLEAAREYSKAHGLKLYLFHNIRRVDAYADVLLSAGPIEFLQMIHGCEIFFTDSFHGTIFAIIFEKQFITFRRFHMGNEEGQNTRVWNLLSSLDLEGRFLNEHTLDLVKKLPPVSYPTVKHKLEKQIEESKDYLIRALKN